MVFFAPVFGAAALFAGLVSALPRPDSSSGDEVAVSAPNGVVLSDTAELSSQLASESAAAMSSAYYAATTTSAYYAAATSSAAAYGYGGASSSSAAAYGYGAASSSSMNNGGYYTTSAAYSAATYTNTAMATAVTMSYGSGSSNWGGSGYNDCVNQCIASFGAPPAMYTPTASSSTDSGSSGGSGTTHTVIVAPTQGVLRYVPFAVNASVGDTIHFVWNANNHTVTKSSELQLCNKTSDAPFVTGEQNKGFTFDQVVNDTNPTFYYCGTPTHCEKGMFGIINPPSEANAATSVGMMMPALVANSSTLSAMWAYTSNMTKGNLQASMWGQNINLAQMPTWSHQYVMENVMYAQTLFAENPDVLGADGKVDMSAGGNPIKFPQDITAALNGAAAGNSSTGAAAAAPAVSSSAAASSSSSAAAAPTGATNGARGTIVSSGLLGVAVLAASLLAL